MPWDPRQVQRWLARRGRGGLFAGSLGRLGLLTAAAAATVMLLAFQAEDNPVLQAAPLALMVAVVLLSWRYARRTRRLQSHYNRAMTAMRTAQWAQAYEYLGKLLAEGVPWPTLRGASLLALAEIATRAGRHDEAVGILEEVIHSDKTAQHRQAAEVARAHALLRAGRLTDATDVLDRLRTVELPEPLATMAAVGRLHRRIRTRNFAGAAEGADALARRAREVLGRQAAGVYLLIAAALAQLGRMEQAQTYYTCATLLQPGEDLARRFADVAELTAGLTPARSPW